MMRKTTIGRLEQLVLLGVLQLADEAYALRLRDELKRMAGHPVSRGALYRTLDRLEQKGFIEWETETAIPRRGGHPRRRFNVTTAGIHALRASRQTLLRMWSGLEETLDETA